MKLKSTSAFDKKLAKKISGNPALKAKISKQVSFLLQDITHPSLKVHKLKGIRHQDYALWIEGNLRIIFKIDDDNIIFTDLITHDEY